MSAIAKILQLLVKSAAKEAPEKSTKVGKILGELKDSGAPPPKTKQQLDSEQVHKEQNDIMESINKLNSEGKIPDEKVADQAELLYRLVTGKK